MHNVSLTSDMTHSSLLAYYKKPEYYKRKQNYPSEYKQFFSIFLSTSIVILINRRYNEAHKKNQVENNFESDFELDPFDNLINLVSVMFFYNRLTRNTIS